MSLKAGSYDESLKHLDNLQELNKDDYKITMNKAITEFYKSGQTTTGILKQMLMTLKNQVWYYICLCFIVKCCSSNVIKMLCIYSYELLLLIINRCLQMHTAVEDIDGLDDVENSILYYNQAVIHYHMRQYSEAISIGEKLYQFLEPFGMFQNAM